MADLLAKNAADEATQEARLAALRGRNLLWIPAIWVVDGMTIVERFYKYEKARYDELNRMGVNLYVVLDPTLPGCKEYGDKVIEDGVGTPIYAEMQDASTAVQNIKAAAEASGVKFDGVMSFHDNTQYLVGCVAEAMGLPGNSPQAYDYARNKLLSRDICNKKGVNSPKFAQINSAGEIDAIVAEMGLPLVLKPSSGAGSLGVYRCDTIERLRECYQTVYDDLLADKLYSWTPGQTDAPTILVEQYIDGDEFDVDLIFWDGKLVYGSVTDNWPTVEPYFLENGANTPTVYPDNKRQELIDYARDVCLALGFKQGPFHVECKYTDRLGGPMLIECNPRVGGECIMPFNKAVYGVNLLHEFVISALGVPVNPQRHETPACGMVMYSVCAPKTGYLLNERWCDHIKNHPNVTECVYRKHAGEKVQGYDTGIPEWLASFTVKHDTIDQAMELAKQMVDSLDPPIGPDMHKNPSEYMKDQELQDQGTPPPVRRASLNQVGSFRRSSIAAQAP